MDKRLQRLLTIAGTWLSRPWAVGAVLVYAVLWLAFEPDSFGWHGVATIATLLMTLFIQRAVHPAWHEWLECRGAQLRDLRQEAKALKEVVAEQALELRLLKKSMIADGDGEE